jgi:hypothetical protein
MKSPIELKPLSKGMVGEVEAHTAKETKVAHDTGNDGSDAVTAAAIAPEKTQKRECKNKYETRDLVSRRLLEDDTFVFDALQFLYDLQTDHEKAIARTLDSNFQGFNWPDAKVCSPIAKVSAARGYLTAEELVVCRELRKDGVPRLAKYWRQLSPLLDGRFPTPTAKPGVMVMVGQLHSEDLVNMEDEAA